MKKSIIKSILCIFVAAMLMIGIDTLEVESNPKPVNLCILDFDEVLY